MVIASAGVVRAVFVGRVPVTSILFPPTILTGHGLRVGHIEGAAKPPVKAGHPAIRSGRLSYSYNEMVLAKDDDILSVLHTPKAYVRFRNSEDVFSVVSIGSPFSLTFKKQPNGYTIQIRRSTLRSTETIQWNNPGKDAKSPPDRGDLDFDGHCSVFK
jgi:hypothetical protein